MRLEDPRLLRLLLLLLQNAGERVDLKAAKRRLGLGPAEPMKRFLFELRQALNDPVKYLNTHIKSKSITLFCIG